jgi:hypothetical protein
MLLVISNEIIKLYLLFVSNIKHWQNNTLNNDLAL